MENKTNKETQVLSVREALGGERYKIPIYQRSYAWRGPEVEQLFQDVADYAQRGGNTNYYIGTLVVFPRRDEDGNYFETIDGQQRLTTLSILLCAIRNSGEEQVASLVRDWYQKVNLSFAYREKSNQTLKVIFDTPASKIDTDDLDAGIYSVYDMAWNTIKNVCEAKTLEVKYFVEYLLNYVKIVRVNVPEDTDLNHYFEIMNSRGEQLEKHEIVKAQLLDRLRGTAPERKTFNLIWEACSDMDGYVQMHFPAEIRRELFSEDGSGAPRLNFSQLVEKLQSSKDSKNTPAIESEENLSISLLDLINPKEGTQSPSSAVETTLDSEEPDKYTSLINFPNFLLHVLKIFVHKKKDTVDFDYEDIPLDDKRLLSSFEEVYGKANNERDLAEGFIMELLRLRYLSDRFIIKRSEEDWVLQRLQAYKSGKSISYKPIQTFSGLEGDLENDMDKRRPMMLLSMFHVSATAQIYKYWLLATLYKVSQEPTIDAVEYTEYLEGLARAYMLDRYLAPEGKLIPFDEIIFANGGKAVNKIDQQHSKDEEKDSNNKSSLVCINIFLDDSTTVGNTQNTDMQRGEQVENFVFNYYDYLLWKEATISLGKGKWEGEEKRRMIDDFRFLYRNSVEHFYPQHPVDGNPKMESRYLQSFGNLCLIDRGMNSKFSNNMPVAKKGNFADSKEKSRYSLKLIEMFHYPKTWNEETIKEAERDAKERLEKALL